MPYIQYHFYPSSDSSGRLTGHFNVSIDDETGFKVIGINRIPHTTDAYVADETMSYYSNPAKKRIDSMVIYVDANDMQRVNDFIRAISSITSQTPGSYGALAISVDLFGLNCVKFLEMIHGILTKNPSSHFIELFSRAQQDEMLPAGAAVEALLMQGFPNNYALDIDYFISRLKNAFSNQRHGGIVHTVPSPFQRYN